jgi:hypothetical protein
MKCRYLILLITGTLISFNCGGSTSIGDINNKIILNGVLIYSDSTVAKDKTFVLEISNWGTINVSDGTFTCNFDDPGTHFLDETLSVYEKIDNDKREKSGEETFRIYAGINKKFIEIIKKNAAASATQEYNKTGNPGPNTLNPINKDNPASDSTNNKPRN